MASGREGVGVSTPRIEYIAVNIAAAINAITVANEFNQTLVAVRPKRIDFSDVVPKNGRVLIAQIDQSPPADQAIQTQEYLQEFLCAAIVKDSDTAVTSIDTRLNQVAADIEKKLKEDRTRGGYALNTVMAGSTKFDDGEAFTGIAVLVRVHYRTAWGDPYTAG